MPGMTEVLVSSVRTCPEARGAQLTATFCYPGLLGASFYAHCLSDSDCFPDESFKPCCLQISVINKQVPAGLKQNTQNEIQDVWPLTDRSESKLMLSLNRWPNWCLNSPSVHNFSGVTVALLCLWEQNFSSYLSAFQPTARSASSGCTGSAHGVRASPHSPNQIT